MLKRPLNAEIVALSFSVKECSGKILKISKKTLAMMSPFF